MDGQPASQYEWKAELGGKQPYAIARADGVPMAFAGLWEAWRYPDGEILRTFAILTTDANATVAQLHDRMPVILEPADWPVWLGEAPGDPTTLLRPGRGTRAAAWPVSRRVDTPRSNDAQLLDRVPDAPVDDGGGPYPA